MKKKEKILIIGLFLSKKNKDKIYRTAADQLKEIYLDNNIPIITTSTKINKVLRALDILCTILCRSFSYKIAIAPLYGNPRSLIIEKWSVMLLKLLRKKVALIVHGGRIPSMMKNNPQKYLSILKKADIVICPSKFLQYEIGKYGIKSIIIENVLKLSDYTKHSKENFRPNILWMRTFEEVYDPFLAVKVFKKIIDKYPTAKMIMAGGDKGLLQPTKKMAEELNVINSISFPGYINNYDKNKIAEDFDIYICTNRIDNAPVSLIEMMSLGLPIVSVDSGGIPFMINNGENGLLVKYGDEKEMANKIIEIVENKDLGKKLVINGYETARQYDADAVMKKWNEIFFIFNSQHVKN